MERIKAIETYYKGYRFRSRLEARWAVFFDALGIEYMYEPEGLILPDGTLYLPDFYLPKCKTFFEVKGLMNGKDMHKIEQLIQSGNRVVIGYDAANDEAGLVFSACDYWGEGGADGAGGPMYSLASCEDSVLCRCHDCGEYFFMGYTGCWDCAACGAYDGDHHLIFLMGGDGAVSDEEVRIAVKRFKQARFEHGETPIACAV